MTTHRTQFHLSLQSRTIWVLVISAVTFFFGWPLATTRLGNTLDEGFVLSTTYRFANGDLPIVDEVSGAFTMIGMWYSLIMRVYPEFGLLHFNLLGILLLALTLVAVFLQLSRHIAPPWCGIGVLCALPFITPFHTVFPFYHLTGACVAAWFIYLYSQTLETFDQPRLYGLTGLAGLVLLVAVSIKPPLVFLLIFPILSWWSYPARRIWVKSGAMLAVTMLLPLAAGTIAWLVFIQTLGGFSTWAEAAKLSITFESSYDYSFLSVLGRPFWEIVSVGAGGLVVLGLFLAGWLLLNFYPRLQPWWLVVILAASGIWLFELGRESLLYFVGVRTTPLTRYWGHGDVVSLGIWLSALGTLFADKKSLNMNVPRALPLWQTVLLPWVLYLYVTQMGSSGWISLPIMAGAPLVALGVTVMLMLAKDLPQFLSWHNDWRARYTQVFGWIIAGSVLLFGVASQWAPAFGIGPPGKPRYVSSLPALAGIRYTEQDSLRRLESLVGIVEKQTKAGDHVLAYYRISEIYFFSNRLPAANAVLFYRQHSVQSEQAKIDYMLQMDRLPAVIFRKSDEQIDVSRRPLDLFVRERYVRLETIAGVEVYKRSPLTK